MDKKPLKKILFIDDDSDILTIAKYAMSEHSEYSIKFLTSGEEGIKEAINSPPDLILLDVMMPAMDGIATFKALKLMPKLSHIPIVFFTAKVQKNELQQYLDLGAIDIIIKPFDLAALPDIIEKIWSKYCNNTT